MLKMDQQQQQQVNNNDNCVGISGIGGAGGVGAGIGNATGRNTTHVLVLSVLMCKCAAYAP